MTSDARTLISLSLRDRASQQLKKFHTNWRSTIGDIEQDGGGGLEQALGNMLGGGLGKLGAGLGAFFAADQLVGTTVELTKLAAQSERARAAFDDLAAGAGQSGQAMLDAMRTATAGTVADTDLMVSANRAMMLGVADTAEEMSGLMAAAIERGRALGVSAQQAVSDVITGIGRMSPEILDNLGIVGVAAAFDTYAASLGKTADQLTDVERKQALVNAVLASASPGGQVIDDAAAAFERMDASIANMRGALGQLFSPAVVVVADSLAAAASLLVENWRSAGSAIEQTMRDLDAQALALGDQFVTSGSDYAQQQMQAFQTLAFAVREVNAAMGAGVPGATGYAETLQFVAAESLRTGEVSRNNLAVLSAMVAVLAQATAAHEAQAIAISNEEARLSTMVQAAEQAQTRLSEIMAQAPQMADAGLAQIARQIAALQGEQAGVDWLRQMNAQVYEQIGIWAQVGYSIDEIRNVLLPNYIDGLRDTVEASDTAAEAVVSLGQGATLAGSMAERAFRRMVSGLSAVAARAGVTARAMSAIGSQATGVLDAQGRTLAAGLRRADNRPVERSTDALSQFNRALSLALDTAYTGGSGGSGIGGVADAFSDLQSKIQSVIGEATSGDIGGLDPASFLPREDAINENARRLAAIMRDGIGNQDWLEEFRAEAPGVWEELASSGDPRAAAARMLQEFQAGLRPELLDREQIKQRVRSMILGEQSTAALAQELAQELSSELGVSLAQAQQAVSGALGVGGMNGASAQAVGPDGAAQGSAFVAGWSATVRGLQGEFESSGRVAGAGWGTGFLATVQSGVPSQLLAMLVSLITPGVMAQLAAQRTRTGAQ